MATIYETTLPRQAQCAIVLERMFRAKRNIRKARRLRRLAHELRTRAIRMKRKRVLQECKRSTRGKTRGTF